MVQYIIVGLIVASALAYTVYSLTRSMKATKKPHGCGGGCTGCELKDIKKNCGCQ